MDPNLLRAKPDEVVAILRAREPARILIANGNKRDDRWHLHLAQRWVIQYNFYILDARWGHVHRPEPASWVGMTEQETFLRRE